MAIMMVIRNESVKQRVSTMNDVINVFVSNIRHFVDRTRNLIFRAESMTLILITKWKNAY